MPCSDHAKAAAPDETTTKPDKPRGCTNFKLRQLLRAVSRLYDAELQHAGLKTTQFSLLSNIAAREPAQPTRLAEALGMDASTMTRNLSVLVDHGWAELGPGGNARSRHVRLTAAGREKLAQAYRHWKRAQEKLNQRFGERRLAAMHELIDIGIALLAEPQPPTGVRNDGG